MNRPEHAKHGKVIVLVLVGVLLLGTGFWAGRAASNPTASEEYTTLEAAASDATKDRDVYRSQRDVIQGRLNTFESQTVERDDAALLRESAVKKAEEALKSKEEGIKKREAAVAGAEKERAANTVGDGMWVVGVDIEPGTYKTASAASSTCYWGYMPVAATGPTSSPTTFQVADFPP